MEFWIYRRSMGYVTSPGKNIKHIGGSIIGGVTYSTLHLEDILESILSFDLRQL